MEWSDIRIFLQVVRDGTMAAATSSLAMDHSTISRRITRLEAEAGVLLFERAGRRLVLTAEGEKLVVAAKKLESIIIRDVLTLSEENERFAGHVRIGTTEEFGAHYLASRLPQLNAANPELEIELVALPKSYSLATRQIDILVTLDRPVTGDVRYKRLVECQYGIYASAGYFDTRLRPERVGDFATQTWCGYIKEHLPSAELDFLSDLTGHSAPRYRSASLSVQLTAALSGYALAALPCFVASQHPALERLLPNEAVFERAYWLAVHEDLAKSPRVRSVMTAIENLVARDRAQFAPPAAAADGPNLVDGGVVGSGSHDAFKASVPLRELLNDNADWQRLPASPADSGKLRAEARTFL